MIVVECQEGVVLLGGQTRLRLEPVGEVGRLTREGPLPDHLGNGGSDVEVELLSHAHRRDELPVGVRRQLVTHLARAKGVTAEVVGNGCREGRVWVEGGARSGYFERGKTRRGHGREEGKREEPTNRPTIDLINLSIRLESVVSIRLESVV